MNINVCLHYKERRKEKFPATCCFVPKEFPREFGKHSYVLACDCEFGGLFFQGSRRMSRVVFPSRVSVQKMTYKSVHTWVTKKI